VRRRHRLVLALVPVVLVPVVLALGGVSVAQAAPFSGAPANAHGQCVSESSNAAGQGGRSAVAKQKGSCTPPLVCTENESPGGGDTVIRNSRENTVTVSGSGNPSPGSSLECATGIPVTGGESTVRFTYALGEGTDDCGGGVPRMFVVIDGQVYDTITGDPECSEAVGTTVTYTIPVTGTVTTVGFVYDRQDFGSVTYSDATIGGVSLNI
jgi:hypothetical protein